MALELAVGIVRVKVDRAQLRSEIRGVRDQLRQGLSGIKVKVDVDARHMERSMRRAAREAARNIGVSIRTGFGGGGSGGGGGFASSPRVFGPLHGSAAHQAAAAGMMPGFGGPIPFNGPFFTGAGFGGGGGRGGRGGGGGRSPMGAGGRGRMVPMSGMGAFGAGFGFQMSPQLATAGYFGGVPGLAGAGSAMALQGAGRLAAKGLETYAEFEQQFRRVQIVQREAGATEEAIARLSSQARELGQTTVFSATEAAQAMVVLTQKGFDALEVYQQMPNVLNLAAAGQLEIADAAGIVASVQKQFGMTAEKTADIVDILSKASLNSATNVTDLGVSLSYVGPIAKLSGKELQETVAALMLLSDAGMEASRAGTGLTRVLTKMSDSKKIEMFEAIGVSIRDARGQLRPLADIIEDTTKALGDLSATERVDFAIKVFGERGGPAFAALMEQSAERLRENIGLLEGFGGTARRVADDMKNTIEGRLERMRDAAKELGISFGETFGNETKDAIDSVTAALELLATAMETAKLTGLDQVVAGMLPNFQAWGRVLMDINRQLEGMGARGVEFGWDPLTGPFMKAKNRQFELLPDEAAPAAPVDDWAARAVEFQRRGRAGRGGRGIGNDMQNPIPVVPVPAPGGVGRGANAAGDGKGMPPAGPDLSIKPNWQEFIGWNQEDQPMRPERQFRSQFMGIQELQRSIQLGVLKKEDKPLEEIAKSTAETVEGIDKMIEEVQKLENFAGLA